MSTNKRYQFSGSTADGDTVAQPMSYTHESGYVAFTFYSDEELTNLVTPSAGTVTTTVSENGDAYGSIDSGATNAADVGASTQYTRPNWSGSTRFLKVSLAGIVGAAYFKCVISRFGS